MGRGVVFFGFQRRAAMEGTGLSYFVFFFFDVSPMTIGARGEVVLVLSDLI